MGFDAHEVAVQIEDDFQGFAYHTTLTSVAVYGGVEADMQTHGLKAGADFVVATPGRLQDLMNCGAAGSLCRCGPGKRSRE